MAEKLGEAILELRTGDAGFTQGVEQAGQRAQRLGQTLDKTKGSSAQLAGEMVRTGQSAAEMSRGFEQAGARVESSANAQRGAMQNLGFQLNDVATMFALGASPMQIFASQGGQIIQVLSQMATNSAQTGQAAGEASSDIEGMGDKVLETADKAKDMGGRMGALAGFLSGPWGIAITVAVIALTPFIGKLFEGEEALDAVAFASDKLGEAQGILGSVIDRTTGQINTQSQALLVLARAQAAAGRIGAIQRRTEAEGTLKEIREGETQYFGPMGFTRPTRVGDGTEGIVTNFVQGRVGASFAVGNLEAKLKAGQITEAAYLRAAQAITNYEVEGANIKVFEDAQAALSGDDAAARGLFGPQKKPRGRRERSGPKPRTEAERAEDFDSQSAALERQTLDARLSLATSVEDRAAIQEEILNFEREQRITEIEATDLGRSRKDALIAQVGALLGTAPQLDEQGNLILSANRGLEGQLISRERLAQIEQEAAALAEEQFNARREALSLQLALADTEADRKVIALQLLDAEDAHLRSRLEAVVLSESANDAERQRAQIALDALDATAGARRAAVGRQNETELERYMRGLNATPGQINEALDGISIDGLETLNDGLTKAIMGAESLGDVFKRVADQIIADLLRIAIQQAIIKPLANSLFGGDAGGGGGDALGGLFSSFAGFFATGGKIPTGQFGIVGEEGPEIAFAGPGGLGILSNSQSKSLAGSAGGGASVMIPITIDATGADAAAIARLNAKLDQLKQELPERIVSTVQDASNRRMITMGGR